MHGRAKRHKATLLRLLGRYLGEDAATPRPVSQPADIAEPASGPASRWPLLRATDRALRLRRVRHDSPPWRPWSRSERAAGGER